MPREGPDVPVSDGPTTTGRARDSRDRYPRAARWQPATVLTQLADVTGVVLTDAGRCRGGQIGASYVRWPDGHLSVLTARSPNELAAARQVEDVTAVGRAAGVPAPRCELIAELPSVTAIVQELLPGTVPATPSRRIVAGMVEVNQRCRGLLTDRSDLPAPSLYLRTDGPGFCLHGPMASYDKATARLLAAVEEIGAAEPDCLAGVDLVHFDFHPENVLVTRSGRISGVVDWDGANRSDSTFDLFTLRFVLARIAPELGHWLGGLLRETAAPPVLRACWAHMSLRLIDWSIRELTTADVSAWVQVATDLMP
jgi:Phosphotransferase enzyme family